MCFLAESTELLLSPMGGAQRTNFKNTTVPVLMNPTVAVL